jgi:hypothetical protein
MTTAQVRVPLSGRIATLGAIDFVLQNDYPARDEYTGEV